MKIEKIPEHMWNGLTDYLERGQVPGNFLMAVLQNKFVDAFAHADHINKPRLQDWAFFMYNEMPLNSWGSEAIVLAWIMERREKPMIGYCKEEI